MDKFLFTVSEKLNNIKLVDFLTANGISNQIIQKIKFGNINVNGIKSTNVNDRLSCGDKVEINLPQDDKNPFINAIKGKLDVVYEDEYMLAVVKESGMLTHQSRHNNTPSLDQITCGYFAPKPFTFRAINRLDRDTSGIILIAKDMISASKLSNQLIKGDFEKTYTAVVVGCPKEESFIIDMPIKRQDENSMKRVCASDGKSAKTECKLIKTQNGLSTLDVILHTGRTHQIRVHLSSIGLPLYADALYGQRVQGESYYLCADRLSFTYPFTNKRINLDCRKKIKIDLKAN